VKRTHSLHRRAFSVLAHSALAFIPDDHADQMNFHVLRGLPSALALSMHVLRSNTVAQEIMNARYRWLRGKTSAGNGGTRMGASRVKVLLEAIAYGMPL